MCQQNKKSKSVFHTPSCGISRTFIVFDALLHGFSWADSRNRIARCDRCGALIKWPKAVFKYLRYVTFLLIMSLGSGPYIIQHYFTEELNYQQLTIGSIFIVFPLIFYIVPALLLGLLSWEVVPLNGNDEEAAIALETEKYRQWGEKNSIVYTSRPYPLFDGCSIF